MSGVKELTVEEILRRFDQIPIERIVEVCDEIEATDNLPVPVHPRDIPGLLMTNWDSQSLDSVHYLEQTRPQPWDGASGSPKPWQSSGHASSVVAYGSGPEDIIAAAA